MGTISERKRRDGSIRVHGPNPPEGRRRGRIYGGQDVRPCAGGAGLAREARKGARPARRPEDRQAGRSAALGGHRSVHLRVCPAAQAHQTIYKDRLAAPEIATEVNNAVKLWLARG